jgi:hypothetical protein
MIEFVEQESVVPALKLNNKQFGDNIIKYVPVTKIIGIQVFIVKILEFIIPLSRLLNQYSKQNPMKQLKKK